MLVSFRSEIQLLITFLSAHNATTDVKSAHKQNLCSFRRHLFIYVTITFPLYAPKFCLGSMWDMKATTSRNFTPPLEMVLNGLIQEPTVRLTPAERSLNTLNATK
jgi:hypothetical protein